MPPKQADTPLQTHAPFGAFFAFLRTHPLSGGWHASSLSPEGRLVLERPGSESLSFFLGTGDEPALVNRPGFRLHVAEGTEVTEETLLVAEELGRLHDRKQDEARTNATEGFSEKDADNGSGIPLSVLPVGGAVLWVGLAVILAAYRFRRGRPRPALSATLDMFLAFGVMAVTLVLAEMLLVGINYDPLRRDDLQRQEGYYHLVAKEPSERSSYQRNARLHTETIDGEPFWYLEGLDFHRYGGRGAEPAKKKPSMRVAFIGNSIVFGSGVEEPVTFARLMEKELRNDSRWADADVVNMAVPGYDLPRYKLALRKHLADLRPDLVVIGLWHGDMIAVTLLGDTLYRADVEVVQGVTLVGSLPFDKKQMAWLAMRSRLAQLVMTAVGNMRVQVQTSPVSKAEKMIRDLDDIERLARTSGTKTAYLWFPPLDVPFSKTVENHRNGVAVGPSELFARLRDWANAGNVPFLDVATLLTNDDVEALRLDPCCHYNEAGHRRLAEALRPFLFHVLAGTKVDSDDELKDNAPKETNTYTKEDIP